MTRGECRQFGGSVTTDAERLAWAIRHISGKAWRDAGLVYGDTSQIPDMIDAAIAGERSRLAYEAEEWQGPTHEGPTGPAS